MVRSEHRVCMFAPTADGGHARYVHELMSALVDRSGRSCRFELVTSTDLDERFWTDRYRINAILPALRHRDSFSTRMAWIAARLTHYARREMQFMRWLKERPDITAVHFQEWTPWLAAWMFERIRKMGKQVFYTVHNIVPHRYPAFVPKPLMNHWIRRACNRANGLFVHTGQLAQQLAEFLGEPHPPIYVTPHGVWSVSERERGASTEERLSWKRLLFFGAIRRNKGVDLLLRAAPLLKDFSITIAGEPLERVYFHNEVLPLVRRLQADGLKIELRDQFLPEEGIGPLFAWHSAVVLPYTQQFTAQSGVVFLALAYELPVVASEAGGLHELMREHEIGTTFQGGAPEALAEAVRRLWEQRHPLRLQRELRAAQKRYSWDEAAEATLSGYGVQTTRVRKEHVGARQSIAAH
jgi:glycosyltransferase involved in cell wall biosynthesis